MKVFTYFPKKNKKTKKNVSITSKSKIDYSHVKKIRKSFIVSLFNAQIGIGSENFHCEMPKRKFDR